MLQSLTVSNIVLIEQLTLQFAPGLTVLTGETGAGKSILLDALGLALGSRANFGLIRQGHGQAHVSASFALPENHPPALMTSPYRLGCCARLVIYLLKSKASSKGAAYWIFQHI